MRQTWFSDVGPLRVTYFIREQVRIGVLFVLSLSVAQQYR